MQCTYLQITSMSLATIVAGTLAERCQMAAYLLYSMMLTGFGKFLSLQIY